MKTSNVHAIKLQNNRPFSFPTNMRLGAKPEKVETLQLILPTVQPENFITSTTTSFYIELNKKVLI
jgi:hypothetical protein